MPIITCCVQSPSHANVANILANGIRGHLDITVSTVQHITTMHKVTVVDVRKYGVAV